MKHLIFTLAFLTSTCTLAIAGDPPTRESIALEIQQGRTQLSSKIEAFENSIKTNNNASSGQLVAEIQALFRQGMALTKKDINLTPKTENKAINARYLEQEQAAYQFRLLSGNVPANAALLLDQAKAFLKQY